MTLFEEEEDSRKKPDPERSKKYKLRLEDSVLLHSLRCCVAVIEH